MNRLSFLKRLDWFRPGRTLAALVAFTCLLLAGPGVAQDKSSEVMAAMEMWATSYGSATSPEQMLKHYHPEAVFWGTGARQPFVGAAEIAPYFAQQFENFPRRSVGFIDPVIRFYGGNTATATGLYRFDVETAAGEAISVVHRFSVAFIAAEGTWTIIHQHSSQLPQVR